MNAGTSAIKWRRLPLSGDWVAHRGDARVARLIRTHSSDGETWAVVLPGRQGRASDFAGTVAEAQALAERLIAQQPQGG